MTCGSINLTIRSAVRHTYDYLVIMGAAVRPDGTPSQTLLHRVMAAVSASERLADPRFLASGGRHGGAPSEGGVMRKLLLQQGVLEQSIVIEEESTNTLSSVRNCASILKRAGDASTVTVCTDGYHLPRCRLLFWAFGVTTVGQPMPSARRYLSFGRWFYYCCREVVATPLDVLIAAVHRS